MNKPKRSPTLDSFVIKKSKNISTISSDPVLDQENVVSNNSILEVDVNQHVINNNINEIIAPLVSLANNQLSIENNNCSLIDSTTSNEQCFLMPSTCSRSGDSERADTSLLTSTGNYCENEKENYSGRSAAATKDINRCEKLISNLLSLKKINENIDVLLTMFKSANDSKELCARETYTFSDDVLKIVNDLRLCCETYLFECVNNRPLASNSLQTSLERDPGAYANSPRFGDDELKHIISLGPYQPRLSSYPKLQKMKKNANDEIIVESDLRKTTSFQARWYDDYPLIEYSILKDRIYCFVCRLFGHGPGALCADPA